MSDRIAAIVTGAGSGIGLAVTRALVADGYSVVMNGRNEEKLARAAALIDAPGQLAIAAGDFTRLETGRVLIETAVARFGGVDVLVNNAGRFQSRPFVEYTADDLDGYLAYLRGTFQLTRSAVIRMRLQRRGGSIVNVGTTLAANGVNGVPASAPVVAKGGITALTKSLSVELASDNIRINEVAPGIVPTPLYGELSDEQSQTLHGMRPPGRFGTPEDVADAVRYLVGASLVTGVVLPVDGGVDAGGGAVFHGERSVREADAEACNGEPVRAC